MSDPSVSRFFPLESYFLDTRYVGGPTMLIDTTVLIARTYQ